MNMTESINAGTFLHSKQRDHSITESSIKLNSEIKNTACLDLVASWTKKRKYRVLEKNYDSIVLFQNPGCSFIPFFKKNNIIKAS